MAVPTKCIGFVLSHEDPAHACLSVPDSNGYPVISGINAKYWASDYAAIEALPQSERLAAVTAFYEKNYWNRWLSRVVSNNVAAYTLDAMVNQGSRTGVRILQDAINALVATPGPYVEADGFLGPATVAAANSSDPASLVQQLCVVRCAAYGQIGGPNLAAWLKRAQDIPNFD